LKYSIDNIESIVYEAEKRLVRARAKNGSLELRLFSPRCIGVTYRIDSMTVPPVLQRAHGELCGDVDSQMLSGIRVNCRDGDKSFTACLSKGDETTEVSISKRDANISVKYRGKNVLGGELGTEDNSIPHTQMRCIVEASDAETSALPVYRFNFPMDDADAFYGLGDKGGVPNHRGKRYRMFGRDALGFDAEYSDPLYKSIPFIIKHNGEQNTYSGLYFPESLIDSVDLGREANMFYNIDVRGGPASYYVFTGQDYKDILREYCGVTGLPALPPLYAFGFYGCSMNYLEADNAAERVLKFFERIEKYKIPCEGMYVASGYLKADDGNRYTFFWNRRKFPDPAAFLGGLAKRGYHLCMNIKPGILKTHPWYEELCDKGYLLKDKAGKPIVEYYWGGQASFIDFANPEAREWWKAKLKENYLDYEGTGIWNDNNECELEDTELDAYKDRVLYAVRMAKTGQEAWNEARPDLRPFNVCRAGYAGLQKYAITWSGDNRADFKTLKFNQYQGVTAGLSGLPYFGHDIGGFYGPPPSAELLTRSYQTAVFQGRFVYNSWRDDGEPTEPWTYPEALPAIRRFVEEHYRFIPYLYDCAVEASRTGRPIERPLFLEFDADKKLEVMQPVANLFGPAVLKALAVEQGTDNVSLYLPQGASWYDVKTEKLYQGGQTLELKVPLDEYRWLARAGSIVSTAPGLHKLDSAFYKNTEFLLFPPVQGNEDGAGQPGLYTHFEDDGKSKVKAGSFSEWTLEFCPVGDYLKGKVRVTRRALASAEPKSGREWTLSLPKGWTFADGSAKKTFNPADYETGKTFSIDYSGSYNT
jgi:alpha-glucosidase